MPKSPILYREKLYERLPSSGRGNEAGVYRELDWNLVNTTLGAMVEPRILQHLFWGRVTQQDLNDIAWNKMSEFKDDQLFQYAGTGGQQVPRDYNV